MDPIGHREWVYCSRTLQHTLWINVKHQFVVLYVQSLDCHLLWVSIFKTRHYVALVTSWLLGLLMTLPVGCHMVPSLWVLGRNAVPIVHIAWRLTSYFYLVYCLILYVLSSWIALLPKPFLSALSVRLVILCLPEILMILLCHMDIAPLCKRSRYGLVVHNSDGYVMHITVCYMLVYLGRIGCCFALVFAR